MSKFNLLVHIQAYEDSNPSNNPSRNYVKWLREMQGISGDKPQSLEFSLAPGESKSLFNGSRTLAHGGTTEYSIDLKAGTTNTYILSNPAGQAPNFRTPRTVLADNTTEITVTQNGSVLSFEATNGTLPAFVAGGAVVGDTVYINGPFALNNQGYFTIISLTATKISVKNEGGQAEGPITLTGASDIEIFSAAGVQAGDKLVVSGGFSPVSRATYEITQVRANELEFYSSEALPAEIVTTTALSVYYSSRQFVYLEASDKLDLTINGSAAGKVEPFIEASSKKPGLFMIKSTMWSMSVQNNGLETVTVYVTSIE
jgi:hypothetical protein